MNKKFYIIVAIPTLLAAIVISSMSFFSVKTFDAGIRTLYYLIGVLFIIIPLISLLLIKRIFGAVLRKNLAVTFLTLNAIVLAISVFLIIWEILSLTQKVVPF